MGPALSEVRRGGRGDASVSHDVGESAAPVGLYSQNLFDHSHPITGDDRGSIRRGFGASDFTLLFEYWGRPCSLYCANNHAFHWYVVVSKFHDFTVIFGALVID